MRQIFQVYRERVDNRTGKTSHEISYAITNADQTRLTPAMAAQAIRDHWQVENALHRQKDVRMKEDDDRTHTRHAPHNLASLRNIALAILNRATAIATPSRRWQVAKTQPWRIYKAMGVPLGQ